MKKILNLLKKLHIEMRELSYAGFSVFHDEALQPLYKHRIPVVIKTQIIQGQRNLYSP